MCTINHEKTFIPAIMAKRNLIPVTRTKILLLFLSVISFCSVAQAQLRTIAQENALPGSPKSEWDVFDGNWGNNPGGGSLEGFSDKISYLRNDIAQFKIRSSYNCSGSQCPMGFKVKIYRLGWYGGSGARRVDNYASGGLVFGSGSVQPDCSVDVNTTGLLDCGNWSVTFTWQIPADATPGVYIVRLGDQNTPEIFANHIAFVVRENNPSAKILFKTSDATWQAYNHYGGISAYHGYNTSTPNGRAHKLSYNRPFYTRSGFASQEYGDWLFNAEYPMIRFLERNGYDVTYTTDVDMDNGNTTINPSQQKIFLSVGHDEYWSLDERNRVEAAADAGVNLAFYSGNEVYWKIRWEDNHRTMVVYKEGTPINGIGENMCDGYCDPSNIWTGLWRAPEGSDANRPENALTGQISWEDALGDMVATGKYKSLRLWRQSPVAGLANNGSYPLSAGSLGYEWSSDRSDFMWAYPHGKVQLTTTTLGGKDHHLVLFRNKVSNALVFGAGSIQFAWGLDATHDPVGGLSSSANQATQQFTVNLFAEMGVMPTTLMGGLTSVTAYNDVTPPTTTISAPANNFVSAPSTPVTISGSSSDHGNGARMGGMEISIDGGATWNRLPDNQFTSTINWSYTFTPPTTGTYTIKVRGFDDLGNLEDPDGTNSSLTRTIIVSNPSGCPTLSPTLVASSTNLCPTRPVDLSIAGVDPGTYTVVVNGTTYTGVQPNQPFTTLDMNAVYSQHIFDPATQGTVSETVLATYPGNDPAPIEVGMAFRAGHDGYINGLRYYYRGSQMSGSHRGKLYTSTGVKVADIVFGAPTGVGWQTATLSSPVEISANATYYVTVLHSNGYYARTQNYFTHDVYSASGDIWALRDGEGMLNGRYHIGPNPSDVLPSSSLNASNYWVDVVYQRKAAVNATTYNLTSITNSANCNQTGAPLSSVTVYSATTCEALPVRFLSFTGRLHDSDVILNWSTAMESINDKFVIERSKDGNVYTAVGEVKGSYNSTIVQYYTFTDPDIDPGTYQYRLKQVDVNGNFSYSNTITVTLMGGDQFQLAQNNPNPLTTTAVIEYYVPYATNVSIVLMDINGKPIRQLTSGQKMKGKYNISLSKGNLAAGVYLYRLTANDKVTITRKMVVQ